MNAPVLVTEVNAGGTVEQIAKTFGVDWPHLGAQIVSFSIVCIILYRFAYRPILRMLEERRRQIAQGLADTETIKAELARTEAQRRDVLIQANAEASKSIEDAREGAARLQERESQKATAAAEQILAKAHEAASQDYARMLAELKLEVGRLVVQTTAKVAGKILTPEDQRRLAEETARQLTG
jgi:F-type H+-transporting ATPase subunit b